MCEHEHFTFMELTKLGYLGMSDEGEVLKMMDVGVCRGMLFMDPAGEK